MQITQRNGANSQFRHPTDDPDETIRGVSSHLLPMCSTEPEHPPPQRQRLQGRALSKVDLFAWDANNQLTN